MKATKTGSPRASAAGATKSKKTSVGKKAGWAKNAKTTQGKKVAKGGRSGPLTRADRVFLRGLGHQLDPVIQVGLKGLSDTLLEETRRALRAHELIKVKLGKNAPDEVVTAADTLASMTGAEVVQVIGGVVLLYAEPSDREKRKIQVPGR